MKGIDVKKKLLENGYLLKNVAELMGETPQNLNSMLNAKDIKTGVVEKIALAIKKPLYFFFNDIEDKKGENISKNDNGNEIILTLIKKNEELNQEIGRLKAENKHLRKLQDVLAHKRTDNLDSDDMARERS